MDRGVKIEPIRHSRKGEEGYALPSILMLVTLLVVVALSVVTLQYFRRQEVLSELHLIKSDLAARSGIARTLARLSCDPELLENWESLHFDEVFQDSSRAHIELRPWGMFLALRGQGFSSRFKSDLTLLAANRLTVGYAPALTLKALNHQLVMTGTAMIRGDVSVGTSGATTGTLRDYSTPLTLPIQGKIKSAQSASFPRLQSLWINAMARRFGGELSESGRSDPRRRLLELAPDSVSGLRILDGDTVDVIRTSGQVRFSGSIKRLWPPLVIVVRGGLELLPGAHLDGLVMLVVTDTIVIKAGCRVREAILFSGQAIKADPLVELSGQFISPSVELGEGATLLYPSAAVALDGREGELKPVSLEVHSGASVEGFAGVFHTSGRSHPMSQGVFSPRSRMIGIICAASRLTLDGNVAGSVVAEDLYFYLAPTHYYGWMKGGLIDRSQLPERLLIPPAVAERTELEILKWMGG